MKVTWTLAAREDLENIQDYIRRDSPQFAAITTDRIIDKMEEAGKFPRLAPPYSPADDENVRRLPVGPYGVIYLIDGDLLRVLSVFHGSRDPDSMDPRYWEIPDSQ